MPQYVLEDAAARGVTCNIIVAQPRRVSAMSVAERVASERGICIHVNHTHTMYNTFLHDVNTNRRVTWRHHWLHNSPRV